MTARRLVGSAARLLLFVAGATVGAATGVAAQRDQAIGLVDFYGYGDIPRAQLMTALALKPGDAVPAEPAAAEARLRTLPGVRQAVLERVCCDDQGNSMIFGGLVRTGSPVVTFFPRPTGSVRVSDSLRAIADSFVQRMFDGIRSGEAGDSVAEGHSLMSYGPAREWQRAIQRYAVAHEGELRRVLRGSSSDADRAIAAEALGYAADKKSVIPDLVAAARDPYGDTRNNAVRALYAIGILAQRHPELKIVVPVEEILPLLYSPVWTDRNKTSLALFSLSQTRDPALLELLKAKALEPLLEIARWQSSGHAFPAFFIVARIAGVSDEEAFQAFQAGERERILARVSQH